MIEKICKSLKAIFPIWCEDSFDKIEQKNRELNSKYEELKKELDTTQKENKNLKEELKEALNKLEEVDSEYFKKIKESFELYNSLSLSTKENLKNIFKEDDLIGFLVSGVQNENVKSLWDYIQHLIVENKNSEEIEKLKTIFYFLFGLNSSSSNYILDEVKVGDKFDEHSHINISENKSGEISEVVFKGFKNKHGKIIQKSIVKV